MDEVREFLLKQVEENVRHCRDVLAMMAGALEDPKRVDMKVIRAKMRGLTGLLGISCMQLREARGDERTAPPVAPPQ